MLKDDDQVEGLASAKFHSEILGKYVRRGDTVKTTVAYARHLIAIGCLDAKSVKPVGGKPVQPGETKPAGPRETKAEEGDSAKKSFGASATTESASSPSSSAPGAIGLRSFSAAGLVSILATACSASRRAMTATAGRLRSLL